MSIATELSPAARKKAGRALQTLANDGYTACLNAVDNDALDTLTPADTLPFPGLASATVLTSIVDAYRDHSAPSAVVCALVAAATADGSTVSCRLVDGNVTLHWQGLTLHVSADYTHVDVELRGSQSMNRVTTGAEHATDPSTIAAALIDTMTHAQDRFGAGNYIGYSDSHRRPWGHKVWLIDTAWLTEYLTERDMTHRLGSHIALLPTSNGALVVNDDGTGTRVHADSPFTVSVYPATTDGSIAMIPVSEANFPLDELISGTHLQFAGSQDMAEWVRVFSARIETNFRILTDEAAG